MTLVFISNEGGGQITPRFLKMIVLLFLVLFPSFINGNCDFEISSPSLRQIDKETVLIHWVHLAQDNNFSAFRVKFWPASDPNSINVRDGFDSDVNFEFVNVEEEKIYSYQMIMKASGKVYLSITY